MKRLLCVAAVYWVTTWNAEAHVGSPNVFFEGLAGIYPVRVVIRPPATLPGLAQVDVRVAAVGVTNVALRAVPWGAGPETAPPPSIAVAVPGETNLFNGALSLFRKGAYSIHVDVNHPSGRGTVVVPLNSSVTGRPVMSPAMSGLLIGLGMALVAGAIALARAASLAGAATRSEFPLSARDYRRARFVALTAAGLLAAGIAAGAARWRVMDREFRLNVLDRNWPVQSAVHTNGTIRLLKITSLPDSSVGSWNTLLADHGKLMHLFLLREPDWNSFAHLHPVRRDAETFENVLPKLPAGVYQLYAEVTQEDGWSRTLTSRVVLPSSGGASPQQLPGGMTNEVLCQSPVVSSAAAPQPFALDADDSWHIHAGAPNLRGHTAPLMDGSRMVCENVDELVENRETSLRFGVFDAQGHPMSLQNYMGMLGHAVVRHADGTVFTHLHPSGTVSMAAQELLARQQGGPGPSPVMKTADRAVHAVSFPYAFPRPGNYRVWVQVRCEGRVLTGVFELHVRGTGS